VQIGRDGVLYFAVALRNDENAALVDGGGRLDGRDGQRAPHAEGHDGVREKHDVPQRQDWKPLGDVKDFAVAEEQRHAEN
jgi:hypothetical protein